MLRSLQNCSNSCFPVVTCLHPPIGRNGSLTSGQNAVDAAAIRRAFNQRDQKGAVEVSCHVADRLHLPLSAIASMADPRGKRSRHNHCTNQVGFGQPTRRACEFP